MLPNRSESSYADTARGTLNHVWRGKYVNLDNNCILLFCQVATAAMLTPYSAALLASMPAFIQGQLLLEQQASDDKAQV